MISTIKKLHRGTINKEIVENEDDISEIDSAIEMMEQDDELLDDIAEEATMLSHIKHMRCVVHTLQLAIRNGLKERHVATEFRQVATAA